MSTPGYQNISVSALCALEPGTRLIDVREADEFTGPLGHLPGAELVPLASVPAAAATWRPDQPLLLICRSGARSARAAQFLASRGFTRVYNLEGGMLAIVEAGIAVEGLKEHA